MFVRHPQPIADLADLVVDFATLGEYRLAGVAGALEKVEQPPAPRRPVLPQPAASRRLAQRRCLAEAARARCAAAGERRPAPARTLVAA